MMHAVGCSARAVARAARDRGDHSILGHAVLFGTGTFELTPPDASDMAQRREALLAGGYPYLVAEREVEIVGYGYAGAYRTRPAYRSTVENSVYVREDAQKGGIGRSLLERLIEGATWRGLVDGR